MDLISMFFICTEVDERYDRLEREQSKAKVYKVWCVLMSHRGYHTQDKLYVRNKDESISSLRKEYVFHLGY